MPGFLLRRSISKPESSARQNRFVFFEKYFDFIREFCSKVLPFSLGLLRLNSEVENVFMYFGNKALISFNYPLLFVPINNFLIFLFCI